MSTVNYLERDDDETKHGDREDVAEQSVEFEQKIEYVDATGQVRDKIVSTTKQTLVCSCGSTTCFAISAFGLPRPLFSSDIEPIPSQNIRDMRAYALKQGGAGADASTKGAGK